MSWTTEFTKSGFIAANKERYSRVVRIIYAHTPKRSAEKHFDTLIVLFGVGEPHSVHTNSLEVGERMQAS